MKILESASKVVFVLMAIALVVLTTIGIVEAKDFVTMVAMAFTYYFTKQNNKITEEDYIVEE